MFFESLLVLGVLAVILVFFYKQAVREFRILQTESLEKAQGLLSELCPIVVLPVKTPKHLWTRKDIAQRPTLGSSPYNGLALKDAVNRTAFSMPSDTAEALAKDVGVPIWVQQSLLPTFKSASWWTPTLLQRSEVAIGAQGLRQTYGYTTVLLPTEEAIQVSLLHESANPYLPIKWQGKRVSKLTRDDAPMLSQIDYIDVIVRPGSALLVPPHWKVCWENLEPTKPALTMWVEIHHPVSWLVRSWAHRPPKAVATAKPK